MRTSGLVHCCPWEREWSLRSDTRPPSSPRRGSTARASALRRTRQGARAGRVDQAVRAQGRWFGYPIAGPIRAALASIAPSRSSAPRQSFTLTANYASVDRRAGTRTTDPGHALRDRPGGRECPVLSGAEHLRRRCCRGVLRTVIGCPIAGSIRALMDSNAPSRWSALEALALHGRKHREREPESGHPVTGLALESGSP